MRELYQREVLDKLDAPQEEVPELGPEHVEELLLGEREVEALLEEKLREAPPPLPECGYGAARFFKATGSWTIIVRNGAGELVAEDVAASEQEAREQSSGWTGQRGQLSWVARVYGPTGAHVVTYKRGVEWNARISTGNSK